MLPGDGNGGVINSDTLSTIKLDTNQHIMLASTLMWAGSAPMVLLILGVFDVLGLSTAAPGGVINLDSHCITL